MKTNVNNVTFVFFFLKQATAERPRDSGDVLFGSSKLIFERLKIPKQHIMSSKQIEKNGFRNETLSFRRYLFEDVSGPCFKLSWILMPIIRLRCPASSAASSALQRKPPRCSYLTFSTQFAKKLLVLKLAPLVWDDAWHLHTFRPFRSLLLT